jgi:hypothetical protein
VPERKCCCALTSTLNLWQYKPLDAVRRGYDATELKSLKKIRTTTKKKEINKKLPVLGICKIFYTENCYVHLSRCVLLKLRVPLRSSLGRGQFGSQVTHFMIQLSLSHLLQHTHFYF